MWQIGDPVSYSWLIVLKQNSLQLARRRRSIIPAMTYCQCAQIVKWGSRNAGNNSALTAARQHAEWRGRFNHGDLCMWVGGVLLCSVTCVSRSCVRASSCGCNDQRQTRPVATPSPTRRVQWIITTTTTHMPRVNISAWRHHDVIVNPVPVISLYLATSHLP